MSRFDGDPKPWADLLKIVARNTQAGLMTGLPGTIVSFDPTTGEASVQPVVRQPGGVLEPEGYSYPVIHCVPVMVTGAAGMIIRPPAPQPGDGCWLQFSAVSLSPWLITGEEDQAPESRRRHALTDAVAVMGLRSLAAGDRYKSDPSLLWIGFDDDTSNPGNNQPLRITLDPSTREVRVRGATITLDADTTVQIGANAAARAATIAELKAAFDSLKLTLDSLTGATFGVPYVAPSEASLTSSTKTILE